MHTVIHLKRKREIKLFKCFIFLLIFLFILIIILFKSRTSDGDIESHTNLVLPNLLNSVQWPSVYGNSVKSNLYSNNLLEIIPEKYDEHKIKTRIIRDKIKRLTSSKNSDVVSPKPLTGTNGSPTSDVTRNIHIFYTTPIKWYYISTNKDSTPRKTVNVMFYPALGLYNLFEHNIIGKHFKTIRSIGIGVIIISWSPYFSDNDLFKILEIAHLEDLQVAIEIKHYANRTSDNVRRNIEYLIKTFGREPAFYRVYIHKRREYLPLIYLQDVGSLSYVDWWNAFSKDSINSIRNTAHDAIVIAHIKDKEETSIIQRAHFDGFYTRLPCNGVTFTSTWKNWATLKNFAQKYKVLFVPTVGPGYSEKNKLPNSNKMKRHRTNGQYFGFAWRTAISMQTPIINVFSFNDWTSGTQIEEAIPISGYKDYQPGTPTKYIDMLRKWVQQLIETKTAAGPQNVCEQFLNNTIC